MRDDHPGIRRRLIVGHVGPNQQIRDVRNAGLALIALLLASTSVQAYEPVAVTDGGSVGGRVTYKGEPPVPETIAVRKDPEVCGREKTAANLIVGADKGIKNVVARLLDVRRGKPFAKKRSVTIDQKNCEYTPRILLFQAGTRVAIENNDGILHNTNVVAEKNPSFTIAQPKFRRVVERRIDDPEMPMRVRCDVHSWMTSWWIAQEHPYYAVTKADGSFTLSDVPPGDYTLEVWHETLGRTTRPLTINPNAETRVSVEMTKR